MNPGTVYHDKSDLSMLERRKSEELSNFLRILQRRLSISTQGIMASQIGMTESTYKKRLKHPDQLTTRNWWQIERMAIRAGMKVPEVLLHDV